MNDYEIYQFLKWLEKHKDIHLCRENSNDEQGSGQEFDKITYDEKDVYNWVKVFYPT